MREAKEKTDIDKPAEWARAGKLFAQFQFLYGVLAGSGTEAAMTDNRLGLPFDRSGVCSPPDDLKLAAL